MHVKFYDKYKLIITCILVVFILFVLTLTSVPIYSITLFLTYMIMYYLVYKYMLKHSKYSLIFWIAIGILGIISLNYHKLNSIFEYAKYSSTVLLMSILVYYRLQNENKSTSSSKLAFFYKTNLIKHLILLVIVSNVFEACIYDFYNQNYINSFIAIYLILSITNFRCISLKKFIYLNEDNYLIVNLTFHWVIVYTLWNINFGIANKLTHILSICAVLVTALLACVQYCNSKKAIHFNESLYMQARFYTLPIRYMILPFYDLYSYLHIPGSWQYLHGYTNDVSYILMVYILLYHLYNIIRKNLIHTL